MNKIILQIILIISAYFIGSFSVARILVKVFMNKNIYKIGTGNPDAGNVFDNVSRPLGILVGLIDFLKVLVPTCIVDRFILKIHSNPENSILLLIASFAIVIGHCVPFAHNFKGGRGIIAYMGVLFYFIPYQMIIITMFALILIIFFNQKRFSQYMIVILSPLTSFFWSPTNRIEPQFIFITSILMGILNFFVSKRHGEI